MPSLDDVLAAYKDCGLTATQAINLLTSAPPSGVGLPLQTAQDYVRSTQRDCGTPLPSSESTESYDDSSVSMPDYNGFWGFLMLYMGMK